MSWFRKQKTPSSESEGGEGKKHGAVVRVLGKILKFIFVTVLWGILRSVGRVFMWSLALTAAIAIIAVLGFVFAPELMQKIDAWKPELFDAQLGTKREEVVRLRDPGYFAEQSAIVTEDDKSVACISSPVRRILIADATDIPELFTKAILASEDKRFFEHSGVDMEGIGRAAWKQYVLRTSTSGASTLTMQMAKDLRHGTGRRTTTIEKIGDIVMALRIEREFSKHQLLLKYVNMPYFGRGQYGIEAASRAYFGKSAMELKLHQVAFIVALISKPGLPFRLYATDRSITAPEDIRNANWQEMLRITRRVLERMQDEKKLTDIEYARAADAIDKHLKSEIRMRGTSCGANDYFLEQVRVQYKDRFPINKGGLTIAITRDDALQNVLSKAVKMTVDTYLARHQNDLDNADIRAGAFAIDFTGSVLAEVGNVDFAKVKYDVITSGWRQPGSTFKMYTYGGLVEELTEEALAQDNPPTTLEEITAEVTKRCVVMDAPIGVSLGRGRGIKMIQNFHSNSEPLYRGLMGCKQALGESRNTAAMRAGSKAGIKHVIEMTYRMGMPKDPKHIFQPYPTTAIGASEVNPLGMASAAAFVNGGFKVTPRFVNDVCKDNLSLLRKQDDGRPRACDTQGVNRPPQERVMHPAVSTVMIDLLKGPLDLGFGTAKSLRKGIIPGLDPLSPEVWKMKPDERKKRLLAFPFEEAGEIAGKTGTATNADGRTSDVWLILFVPGPPSQPEKGVMLVFWMGKDSKESPLGDRGTGTTKGFAESGGRNWTHSAATVLAFLQKERGLLRPGFKFLPIIRDEVLTSFTGGPGPLGKEPDPNEVKIVDPMDPNTDPELLKQLPQGDPQPLEQTVPPLGTEGEGPTYIPKD